MKRLLITGSSGMLGSNMVSEIGERYEVFGTYKDRPDPGVSNNVKIDLSDPKPVRAMMDSVDPDFVVHCAALTDVNMCEEDYESARASNITATANLTSALKPGKRFVYISTDSVFDGRRGNYSEEDTPSPLNNYAKTKLEGERLVEEMLDNYVIIRTNIFGWNLSKKGASLAEWACDNLGRRKQISMFTDVIFSPITVNTLSLLIDRLLSMDFVGRLNIGSDSQISKYDFGLLLARHFDFDNSLITPVSVGTFRFKAPRPKNTSLDISKAKGIFGLLPKVEEELGVFYKKRKI